MPERKNEMSDGGGLFLLLVSIALFLLAVAFCRSGCRIEREPHLVGKHEEIAVSR